MNTRILVATTCTAMSPLVASLALIGTAHAQTGSTADDNIQLEEVLVTAQRREEKSRDVPISITTLGTEQLETANVVNLSDTAKVTPGLRFDSQGPAVQPTIRGVGTAVTTSGGGPNVGIYVDGFFNSNTYVADFQLMKAQSIQVLKGPQGTLFGRNTTGGAILVTTADPSTTSSGEVKASYGSYNAKKLQAYGTFGITDNIAMDVEGIYSKGDGYFTNILNGDEKIGEYENWSVRTGLKIDFTDSVSLLLRYTHAQKDDPTPMLVNAFIDNGSAGFLSQVSAGGRAAYGMTSTTGQPLVYLYKDFFPSVTNPSIATKPGDIALNQPISFKAKSDAVQATLKADLGIADLTSYTQYRRDKTPYYGDLDATGAPIFNLFVSVLDKSFSQEFLFNSKAGSPLQWTAGLNYYQIKDTWDVGASFLLSPFGPFGGSTTNTKSYAAFLDATYQFHDDWFATIGGRYSHDLVTDANFRTNAGTSFYEGPDGEIIPIAPFPATPIGTIFPVNDLKKDSFTPRVVLRYKPSEDSSIYGSYTKGYKAGILNVGGLSQKPVKPENINAYEVGYKFDNRVFALDLASFYYDYKNLQVSSFQNGAARIRNAASSEIYGLEAQARYKLTSDFNVNIGGIYTHARYKSFDKAPYYSYCDPTVLNPINKLWCAPPSVGGLGPGALVESETNASGYNMQRAPEFTGNLGASYDIDVAKGVLNLSGNLYYTSSFYFDPEQQFKQGGFALLSLRSQWTDPSEHYTVALSGDNLTNKRYRTQVLFNTLGIGNVWSAGATWALQLGAKF